VLAGLAALLALYALGSPGPRLTLVGIDAAGYILVLAFCLGSLGLGGFALVPGQTHGYASDGAQILRFLRDTPEIEAEVALTTLFTSSMAGKRPRDWDPELIDRSLRIPAQSARGPLARLLAHSSALDRGDVERARSYLAEAMEHYREVTPMARPALQLAAATFAALHDRDAAAARRWLDEAGEGAMVGAHTRLFAEAAVLHAEGRPGVEPKLEAAESALDTSIDVGDALMLRDEIADLRARRAG
jgi:hypothetical protein